MISAALLCLIVGVSDGDTLTARCGEPGSYEQIKIRLSAIDAPEKAQPFGQRAKEKLSDLCFQVQAQITPKTQDRYGRTVADVQCRGQDAGEAMVRSGMAWYYVKYGKGYEHLAKLQALAKSERLGLWADREPTAPWGWRKNAIGH